MDMFSRSRLLIACALVPALPTGAFTKILFTAAFEGGSMKEMSSIHTDGPGKAVVSAASDTRSLPPRPARLLRSAASCTPPGGRPAHSSA